MQTTYSSKPVAWVVVIALAAATACTIGIVLTINSSSRPTELTQMTLKPPASLVKTYPAALKDLATEASAEINTFHAKRKSQHHGKPAFARPYRATTLTSDPDVASYMYSNENGNWDANFGPDGGYIPYETQPCTDGVCYENYPWMVQARRTIGQLADVQRKLANHPRKPSLLHQTPSSSMSRKHRIHDGLWQSLLPSYKGRLQQLAWDVTDFPDIDDDAEIKDAQGKIRDLYDPLAPLEEQGDLGEEEQKEYADFYRAYSAYQLPHEVSNRGGPGAWVAENDRVGGNPLPPNFYPYSEAYYPPGSPRASLTINANGEGSTNVFNVQGPNRINVNIGSSGAGEEEGGYIYPDGKTAVPSPGSPTITREVSGRPLLTGGTEGADEVPAEGAVPCDQDPQCTFWQDAYNDAYW